MSARSCPFPSRTAACRGAAAALLLGAALAPAGAGAAEAVLRMTAQVVSSAQLQVAEPSPAALRTVEVSGGGHFVVLALDARVQRHGAGAGGSEQLMLSWRGAEPGSAEQALPVRYHPGAGGAWNRPGFGVPVAAPQEAPLVLGAARGGELAVFVPEGMQGTARGFVVLTVMADGAP